MLVHQVAITSDLKLLVHSTSLELPVQVRLVRRYRLHSRSHIGGQEVGHVIYIYLGVTAVSLTAAFMIAIRPAAILEEQVTAWPHSALGYCPTLDRNHSPSGPKAHDVLTIKLDHPMGGTPSVSQWGSTVSMVSTLDRVRAFFARETKVSITLPHRLWID